MPDSQLTQAIQADLVARELAPQTHWVDAGYVNTDNLLSSQAQGIDLLGPARDDSSWQHGRRVLMTRPTSRLIGIP